MKIIGWNRDRGIKFISTLLGLFFVFILMGCSNQAKKNDISQLKPIKINLIAEHSVNKNQDKKPSPLNVFVYAVKTEQQFLNTDYMTYFYKKANNTDNIKLIEEYVLKPGETKTIDYKIDPDYPYIGAVAAYRDISNAKWNAIFSLLEIKGPTWYQRYLLIPAAENGIDILFSDLVVSIKIMDKS